MSTVQIALAVWALALAALPAPTVQQAVTPAASPTNTSLVGGEGLNNFTRPLIVCTAERPPMSFCNATMTTDQYSGISTELFRRTATELGWTEGTDYVFRCLELTNQQIINDIMALEGDCDIGTASIAVSAERLDAGVRFAFPYYSSYAGVLAQSERANPTGWAWAKAFSLDLWMASIATMIVWPACIFLIEAYALRDRVKPQHVIVGLEEATWRSLWALLHGETISLATLGAKIAAGCFAFFSLILSSSYTANLVSILTLRNAATIHSARELMGRAVASIVNFLPRLASEYGIIATDANITDELSIRENMDLVRDGKLAAFVYSEPVLEYEVANYGSCDVRIVDKILPYDHAFVFSPILDDGLVNAYSTAQLRVLESDAIMRLEEEFLQTKNPCLENEDVSQQISFKAVYGLWIILAAGLGLGAGIMCANRWHVSRRRSRLQSMTKSQARKAAAEPSLMDLVFTPQITMKSQRGDGETHITSDLVEVSDEEDNSDNERAGEPEQQVDGRNGNV